MKFLIHCFLYFFELFFHHLFIPIICKQNLDVDYSDLPNNHAANLITFWEKTPTYSSVPNRRVGRNKRAGGKILTKH